jgi:hypothetical protein
MAFKYDEPIKEYIVDQPLTEAQCDHLLQIAMEAAKSDDPKKYIQEAGEALMLGGMAVTVIIAWLMKFLKNKYTININKLSSQSKELNDIYTKVNDLLKHDKMARFKHRNDKVNATMKIILLRDKNNPNTYYKLTVDELIWNSEYVVNFIDNTMATVINTNDEKTRQNIFDSAYTDIISQIDSTFTKNHGYITYTEPFIQNTDYKNQRLEDVLMIYKDNIGVVYYNIAYMNKTVSSQMKYLQFAQQAYNRMIGKYGKDKLGKKMVEDVFKKILTYAGMSIDFNDAITDSMLEVIRYYTNALNELYNFIKD